jgi:hypothetical protein
MLDQNNTPPPPDVELKSQMQVMTKMMERMNFVIGNMCDRFEKVGKHGWNMYPRHEKGWG